MHIRIAYIHTNLYSAKNRENESEYTGHTLSKRELQWLRRYDEVSGYCRGDAMRVTHAAQHHFARRVADAARKLTHRHRATQ